MPVKETKEHARRREQFELHQRRAREGRRKRGRPATDPGPIPEPARGHLVRNDAESAAVPHVETPNANGNGVKILRSQAERIIEKFGGVPSLRRVMLECYPDHAPVDKTAYYKWTYPREGGRGTGGIIPTGMLPLVMGAARHAGILLTAEDLYPGMA